MRRLKTSVVALAILLVLGSALAAQVQTPAQTPLDLDAIYKIKAEGLGQQSRVMEITSYLTDVYGPRLTNSPNIKAAAQYVLQKLQEWKLANAHLEPWGPFGRGWSNERFSVNVISPRPFPVLGYAQAWTPGTNGPVTAEALLAPIEKESDMEQYRGKLKGKIVLTAALPQGQARSTPESRRYTDTDLSELSVEPIPGMRAGLSGPGPTPELMARFRAQRELNNKIARFLHEEGVAAWFDTGRGDYGTVFVSAGGSRDPKDPPVPTCISISSEHYGRMYRMLEKKVPVRIEMNIENRFYDDELNSFNIVGEIPGTDKANELVMLGAHFDSWHAGTGATDNGAGSAVMLEALRILKASGLKMRRTVRLGLWTGEEQGLLGSKAYIKEHFGDPQTMHLKPEHDRLSAYFNVDNGGGKIRGIYLQGNEAVAPIFERWMQPFKGLGMTTEAIRNTGGTDHLSYDAVGLPGFQFIQDPMDYDTRTHHSNMDVYERIQEPDMKQMSVIVASFVYLAANYPEKLPRKPLPQPPPPAPGARP
ncbi:MAG TPA: M20/M25/M40 family metallo-hydrolase [Candidatus Dormibacteraeota bacterium]|nr:M20/M25/M40 family metallo-hydrolase [Candidatus Dormibacteraeota bacterium]